ncbi:hypothetical protein BDW67DRAFT_189460 [Aspergillus spinulosporus]
MLIFSSVTTGLGEDKGIAQDVVLFLCIRAFSIGGFVEPSLWLASTEIHSIRLRTYGQANTTLLDEAFAFAAQYWTPYMLSVKHGNMGTNVGYFYFGVTVVTFSPCSLYPKQRISTFEQIDDFFLSSRKASKTSTKKQGIVRTDVLTRLSPTSSLKARRDGTVRLQQTEIEHVS